MNQEAGKDHPLWDNRFSLDLDPEWKETALFMFKGPEELGMKHSITVTIEDDVDISELDEYAEDRMRALESELREFEEKGRGIIRLDNGKLAYSAVYRWWPDETTEVYQRVLYVLCTATGYALIATFSRESYQVWREEVDAMMRSFDPVNLGSDSGPKTP